MGQIERFASGGTSTPKAHQDHPSHGEIHRFQVNGTRLILDVGSGSLHVVDELGWEVAGHFGRPAQEIMAELEGQFPGNQVREAIEELEALKEEGLIFSPVPDLESYDPPQDGPLKALCLNVAHDCNFRCRYCFASTGGYGGSRGLMSREVARRSLDYLLERSGARRHVEVDFFGGEPLLNWDVVEDAVKYGQERAARLGKEVRFTLTTNASLLTPAIADFLNRENVAVVLSLDGRPDINDMMRPRAGGQGTYEQVTRKIREFVDSRNDTNYIIRGTYTRFNKDFASDVLHIAGLGYRFISVEPVVTGSDAEYALTLDDLADLEGEYERLAEAVWEREQEGRPFSFFHFEIDLDRGPCLPRRMNGCGAGYDYLAVTPEGTLYPCHQFVGRDGFVLGDIWRGVTNHELAQRFRQAHIGNKEACRSCWARFYCSGGCHANAHLINGDINEPDPVSCALQKKRLEAALWLQAKRSGK